MYSLFTKWILFLKLLNLVDPGIGFLATRYYLLVEMVVNGLEVDTAVLLPHKACQLLPMEVERLVYQLSLQTDGRR